MSEWGCIDMNCTNYDGDRCTLGFCEPDILDDNITVQDNKNNVSIETDHSERCNCPLYGLVRERL